MASTIVKDAIGQEIQPGDSIVVAFGGGRGQGFKHLRKGTYLGPVGEKSAKVDVQHRNGPMTVHLDRVACLGIPL